METNIALEGGILPFNPADVPKGTFQPCAKFYEPMDFLLFLKEDLPYRADRIDHFLTLLWHPYEQRAIGVKLKGFRFLFQQLQAISKACGLKQIVEDDFMPLISALEVAMTAGLGAHLTTGVERKRQIKGYATAKGLIKSTKFDVRELKKAA